jgi:hypothetical protein
MVSHSKGCPRRAVTVVWNLGLRYLWIDSLCIIQDDPLDWNTEATKMSLVYSNAHPIIAGTEASNGSESCFIDRGHHPHHVRLRAYQGDDSDAVATYKALHPGDIDDIYENPLGKRAWITQEWLLSRRAIHFTRSHLVLSCQETMQSETAAKVVSIKVSLAISQRTMHQLQLSTNHALKSLSSKGAIAGTY